MPLASLISAGAKIAGGIIGRRQAKRDRKVAFAREDSSVQRRVADAKAAGVHPLFALGAPLSSSVPQSIGTMESSIADMGQDIGRALQAGNTGRERLAAVEERYNELTLQNMSLRNDLLASQIAKLNNAQLGPALPDTAIQDETYRPPEITSWMMSGDGPFFTDPRYANAQTYEDRYGDLIQNIAGFRNWVADNLPYYTASKDTSARNVGVFRYGRKGKGR